VTSGLHRLRVAIVVAMAAVLALAAGEIFDRFVWWLLLAPAAVGLTALLTIDRRWTLRLLLAVAAVLAAVIGVVVIVGGNGSDILASFGAGFQRLLSTDWPSPDRPDLVGTITVGLALTTAVSAELAHRSRLHLAPLLPLIVAYIGVIALSAPAGVRLRWTLPLAVLAIILATSRPGLGGTLRERLTLLRGERRLVPVSLIAIGLAASLAAPIALANRADPRRNEPANRAASLLDPIEATLALQAIAPSIDLHEIQIDEFGPGIGARDPVRWRTAALVDYDGRVWTPDLTLRPIGRRLGPPADDAISASITFLDDDLQLVPLPGAAITVDASIETDTARTIVRLADRPSTDDVIELTSRVEPLIVESDPGQIGILEIDENAIGLTELATALVEDGGASPSNDLLTQLLAIESVMSEDFVLRSDASGGGLQRALIDRFLRDTQRGNAEQFTTGFVLLVRSLGVDARVATGFEVEPGRLDRSDGATTLTLASSDARIWPEVRIGDGWVAFDPVPEDEDPNSIPPPPEPQVQTPAAPQPPIAPPPESADEPIVTEDDTDADSAEGLPTVATYALAAAAGISALLIPVFLTVALILGLKWRRRRRRLSGLPPERIRGAWAVATDRLVDAGMTISGSDTNNEIAIDAAGQVPTAHRELHRLATLASATTFGAPVRPDLLAEDATVCLGHVETSMAEVRTRWQRLRWRLSLRSLRSKTASPI
jgi:hypothetical protein